MYALKCLHLYGLKLIHTMSEATIKLTQGISLKFTIYVNVSSNGLNLITLISFGSIQSYSFVQVKYTVGHFGFQKQRGNKVSIHIQTSFKIIYFHVYCNEVKIDN